MTTKPLIERVNGIRLRAGQVWQYRVDGYAGRPFTIAEIRMAVAYNTEGQYIALSHFAAYTFIRGLVDGCIHEVFTQEFAQRAQKIYDCENTPQAAAEKHDCGCEVSWGDHGAQCWKRNASQQPVVEPEGCDGCGHLDGLCGADLGPKCPGRATCCAAERNALNALTPDMPMSGLTDTRTAMLQAMRRSVSARTSWPCCPVSGEGYVADTVTWNPKRVLANRTTIGSQAEYGVRASWTCPCCDGEGEV